MPNKYYIIAIILTLIWMICIIFLYTGPFTHIILVLAFITILIRIIRDE